LDYYRKFEKGRISDWYGDIHANRYRSPDGSIHHENVSMQVGFSLTNEWWFSASVDDGKWQGLRDSTTELRMGWLQRHLYTQGMLSLVSGKRSGEDYKYVSFEQGLEISPVFSIVGFWEWSRLGTGADEERQTQFTISGNWDIDRERNLAIWIVGRDSDLNLCFTFKKTVRSGSDMYFIYGYPNSQSTERRLAMKLVMPLVL
jgi:hypothetical protein